MVIGDRACFTHDSCWAVVCGSKSQAEGRKYCSIFQLQGRRTEEARNFWSLSRLSGTRITLARWKAELRLIDEDKRLCMRPGKDKANAFASIKSEVQGPCRMCQKRMSVTHMLKKWLHIFHEHKWSPLDSRCQSNKWNFHCKSLLVSFIGMFLFLLYNPFITPNCHRESPQPSS